LRQSQNAPRTLNELVATPFPISGKRFSRRLAEERRGNKPVAQNISPEILHSRIVKGLEQFEDQPHREEFIRPPQQPMSRAFSTRSTVEYTAPDPSSFLELARSSDCAPSLMAFSGAGCTSTINPSAPIATPRDSAGTRLRFPVAWLGSRITGRCVSSFSAGIAAMSQVLRVTVQTCECRVRTRSRRDSRCCNVFRDIKSSFTVLLNRASTVRPAALSERFQQHEILHIPRHLHHVSVFRDKSTSRSLITSVMIASLLPSSLYAAALIHLLPSLKIVREVRA